MRTLIVSDLHLGNAAGNDLLRRPDCRVALIDALEDVDRLVLLGDVLELRHHQAHVAMSIAQPFFEDIGEAMAGKEVVIVAGNHDHALLAPWLAKRSESVGTPVLGPEQRPNITECSPMLGRISHWASPATITAAYPGLWIRPDVYATHGHYLDCHLTIPTMERIAIAGTARVQGRRTELLEGVEDHEAVCAPVFAWIDANAAHARAGAALNGTTTLRMWNALGGSRGIRQGNGQVRLSPARRVARLVPALRRRALVGAFPVAVAALNRAGLGPLHANVSANELRKAGLRAMGEVAARVELGNAHIIFGHTHRAGPLGKDDPSEWLGRSGARLMNCGSWTFSTSFLTHNPGESSYWPGSCVLVEDSGPPVLKRLLLDRTYAQLRGE